MTYQEVWLAAYCASLTGQRSAFSPAANNIAAFAKLGADTARADADAALREFLLCAAGGDFLLDKVRTSE